MATYGGRLRQARLDRGYTRPALSRELGVSVSELKRLEEAEERPSGSRYLAGIERAVRFEDTSDPRLSQASEIQLVEALRARIAARQPLPETADRRSTFEVVADEPSAHLADPDAADPTEQSGDAETAAADGDVARDGDDDPSPGAAQA